MTGNIDNMILTNLLITYRNLNKSAYDITQEWDEDYISSAKEKEDAKFVEFTRDFLVLSTIHYILTGNMEHDEIFKESIEDYLKSSREEIDLDKFLKHIDFYIRRYK